LFKYEHGTRAHYLKKGQNDTPESNTLTREDVQGSDQFADLSNTEAGKIKKVRARSSCPTTFDSEITTRRTLRTGQAMKVKGTFNKIVDHVEKIWNLTHNTDKGNDTPERSSEEAGSVF